MTTMSTRRCSLFLAVLPCVALAGGIPWCEELWLDGGGYWRERLVMEFENPTDNVWTGRTVAVDAASLGLKERPLRELRFTDASGRHFRFDRKGADFLFPIDVPPHGRAEYVLYFGNTSAWELADTWKRSPKGRARPTVRRENLDCRRAGHSAEWPAGLDAAFRVPVVVANYSDEDRGVELAAFHLPEATHALVHPEVTLMFEGRKVLAAPYGRMLVFPVHLKPREERTYYLYVGKERPDGALRERLAGSISGSFMLADQVVQVPVRLSAREEEDLLRILSGEANLLKDAAFEKGASGAWTPTEKRELPGVSLRIDETGGAVGPRCATVDVDKDAGTAWRGFWQKVPVKAGRPYFCGTFVRALDMKGEWWSGGVFCDAKGKKMPNGVVRQPHALRTPTGWTDFSRVCDAPAEATSFLFKPWGRYSGRLSLDAMVLAPYVHSRLGAREHAPAASRPQFAARQVSATVKVFPDEPIADAAGPWRTSLALNESEDLQVAVSSDVPMAHLEVEVAPPRNAAGRELAVKTQFVELVPIDVAGGGGVAEGPGHALRYPRRVAPRGDGWRGLWPDPLVRTNACKLAAGATRAFRFTVSAAEGDMPGEYEGRVRWKSAGRTVREDVWRVKLWPFAIPARPTFSATYDIRFERRFWLAPGETDFVAARRRLVDLMAEYKISPEQFDYGTIFTRDADGTIRADFARHDRGAEEFFGKYKFQTAYFPRKPFYVFGYARKCADFLGEPAYEPGETDMSRLRPAYRKAYQTALRMYWEHIKAKGWADRMVLYVSDEPTFWSKGVKERLAAICRMIKEVDPSIPIYSSTWHHVPEWDGLVTVWGAGSYGCFPVEKMKAVREGGARLWFTTDGQLAMDTPYCAEEQLLPVYAFFHGAEQYEYWGVNWVTLPPWRFGWHDYVSEGMGIRTGSGCGFVAYPPCPGTGDPRPCASIRLAAVRDGVELHSYLVMLGEVAKGATSAAAEARALLDEYRRLAGIPNPGGHHSTRLLHGDPLVLDRLRERAGAILSASSNRGKIWYNSGR